MMNVSSLGNATYVLCVMSLQSNTVQALVIKFNEAAYLCIRLVLLFVTIRGLSKLSSRPLFSARLRRPHFRFR